MDPARAVGGGIIRSDLEGRPTRTGLLTRRCLRHRGETPCNTSKSAATSHLSRLGRIHRGLFVAWTEESETVDHLPCRCCGRFPTCDLSSGAAIEHGAEQLVAVGT